MRHERHVSRMAAISSSLITHLSTIGSPNKTRKNCGLGRPIRYNQYSFWAVAYAFTQENFLLLLLLLLLLRTPPPPASRPISQPGGPYPSLQAQIPVLRPKSHPQGLHPNPKAQILLSRDLGLKTGIWAWRLGYGPPG